MTTMALTDHLTVGELAQRAGVATSTLRFYESKSLIGAQRTEGNQRRFPRATLRRVAVIRAAQTIGLSLDEIQQALATLPDERTPTARDWTRLSRSWRGQLDDRIAELEQLRDSLASCIGCGCLSLTGCALFNSGDRIAERGAGARFLLGDRPGTGTDDDDDE